MRRPLLLALLALALVTPAPAQSSAPSSVHLPDLVPIPVRDLRIMKTRTTRILRFSTLSSNQGQGPFELRPEHSGTNTTAYQRSFGHDTNNIWSLVTETAVGTFAYHPAHKHSHFGDFAKYEVRAAGPGGELTDTVVAASDKVTFCIIETKRITTFTPEHPSPTRYSSCTQTSLQGLRGGYADLYRYSTPGQSIDITGVPAGIYWLTQTLDPRNIIHESDDANNTTAIRFEIAERSSRVRYR